VGKTPTNPYRIKNKNYVDLLAETMKAGREWSEIFTVLEENPTNLEFYIQWDYFSRVQDQYCLRQSKSEVIHHQNTFSASNIKKSASGSKKMIQVRNSDQPEKRKKKAINEEKNQIFHYFYSSLI
jgi:hypothetical protein